ncbi:MAG: hypothetical protein PUC44_04525, partial [Eubacteriales bacterium]|nr:hypothetical protein [Eubacteriales bacterium]
ILCVLTASLFHISFVVYFVLLFIPIRKITEKHYKTFLILMLMASGIIFLNGNRIPFYGTLYALIFGDWKTNLYVDSRTHLGWIPYLLYYLFTLAFIVIAGRLIKYAEKKNHIRYDKLRAFQNLCMKCALLLSFDLPLVMMNVDYFRVFFAASLLSFILLSAVFGECTSVRTNLRGDGVIKRETVIQNISWKNRYVMRRTGSIVLIILFWSMIWWKLKINDINLLDALKQNIFYLF